MKTIKKLTVLISITVALLSAFCIFTFAATQNLQETKTAFAPYGSPVIDGYYDEIWDESDRLYFVYDRQGCTVEKLAEKHEYENEDERNWVKVMWDENSLYLFYLVYDSELHYENSIADYNRDGIEFYVDEFNDKAANKADSRLMRQIGVCMTEGYADYDNSFVTCYVDMEDGYSCFEIKYDFAMLEPKGGDIIGFDASVNVNNTGENVRNHCLSWNDRTNTTYKYPVYMGECVLLPKDYKDDFEYVVDEDENGNEFAIITGYNGQAERVSVPMIIEGKFVLAIADDAFDGDANLKHLSLPLTIILFGDINVPTLESVFVNEDNLIYYSSEIGVVFSKNNNHLVMFPCAYPYEMYIVPSHIENIFPYAFNGAKNLKRVILPKGLVNIYNDNFSNCEKLEALNIPESVRVVEDNVGVNCKSLKIVSLLSKDLTIGENFLSDSPVIIVSLYKDNNFEDKLTGSYHKSYIGEKAKIRVEEATAIPGVPFSVDIVIENNTGIAGMRFALGFDREKLTLVDVSYDNSFWAGTCSFHNNSEKHPVQFTYYRADNTISNGTIATLTFVVSEDAVPGDTELNLEFIDDVVNAAAQTVEFEAEDSVVSIISTMFGDANRDGEIDIKDAVILAQYLAGWTVDIDEFASDCNADGTVDIKDAVLLAQFLAGWSVELG